MKKNDIPSILKERIKKRGLTQQKFADLVRIPLPTLRDYLDGKTVYNIEMLMEFADALDCSCDFLLGKSKTPNPEYHTIKEQTDLGEGTIERLIMAAQSRGYDDYVPIYDFVIQNDDLVDMIKDYLEYVNKVDVENDEDTITEYGEKARIGQTYIRVGEVHVKKPDIPNTYLLGIMRCIVEHRYELGEDKPKRIYGHNLKY